MEKLNPLEQSTLEETLKRQFPSIIYDRFTYVPDPGQYFIVDDISEKEELSRNPLRALQEISCGKVATFSMREMVRRIQPILENIVKQYTPNQTLLIFPGNGGLRCRNVLNEGIISQCSSIHIDVKRTKDPYTGERIPTMPAGQEEWFVSLLTDGVFQDCVVVDDAINGGGTLSYIRKLCPRNDIQWIAAAPVLFSPLPEKDKRAHPSSIAGYDTVVAANVFEGLINPVPLNFLSSLLKDNRVEGLISKFYLADREEAKGILSSITNC